MNTVKDGEKIVSIQYQIWSRQTPKHSWFSVGSDYWCDDVETARRNLTEVKARLGPNWPSNEFKIAVVVKGTVLLDD